MKAKAMKKTLSCILALTLTASMMAESLTAFATLDAPAVVEEDNLVAPVELSADNFKSVLQNGKFTTSMGAAEEVTNLVLKSLTISAPDNKQIFVKGTTLPGATDLADYEIVAEMHACTGEQGEMTEGTKLYRFSAPLVTSGAYNFGESIAWKFYDTSAWYDLTTANVAEKVDGIHPNLPGFDVALEIKLPYKTFNDAQKKVEDVTAEAATIYTNAASSTVHAILYKKAVTRARFVPAEGKVYRVGQPVEQAFVDDKIELICNDGEIVTTADADLYVTKEILDKTYISSEVKTGGNITYQMNDLFNVVSINGDTTNRTNLGPDDGTQTVVLSWKNALTGATILVGEIQCDLIVTDESVESLELNDETAANQAYTKKYQLNQPFAMNTAIINVKYNNNTTKYLYYNTDSWYLSTAPDQTQIADWVDDNDTPGDTTDDISHTVTKLDGSTDAKKAPVVTFDSSKATEEGKTTSATIAFGGKTIELGGITVGADKVDSAAVEIAYVSKEAAEADTTGKTKATSKYVVPATPKNKLKFAIDDKWEFVKGDTKVTLTYAKGGTKEIDLAENIDLFTTDAEGKKPVNGAVVDLTISATSLKLYYQGTDGTFNETTGASEVYIEVPVKIIEDALEVKVDFDKTATKVYPQDTEGNKKGVATGITVRLAHTSPQRDVNEAVALDKLGSEWKVDWDLATITDNTVETPVLTITYTKGNDKVVYESVSGSGPSSYEHDISVVEDYMTGFTLSELPVNPFYLGDDKITYTGTTTKVPELTNISVSKGVKATATMASGATKTLVISNGSALATVGSGDTAWATAIDVALPTGDLKAGNNEITVSLTPKYTATGTTPEAIKKPFTIAVKDVAIQSAVLAKVGDEISADDNITGTAQAKLTKDDVAVTKFDVGAAGTTKTLTDVAKGGDAPILVTYNNGKKGLVKIKAENDNTFALTSPTIPADAARSIDNTLVWTYNASKTDGTKGTVNIPVTIDIVNKEAKAVNAIKYYVKVNEPASNPKESGYYEYKDGNYTTSQDTEVDSKKTYYKLDTISSFGFYIGETVFDFDTVVTSSGALTASGVKHIEVEFARTATPPVDPSTSFKVIYTPEQFFKTFSYEESDFTTAKAKTNKTLTLTYNGPKEDEDATITKDITYDVIDDAIIGMTLTPPSKSGYLKTEFDKDYKITPTDGKVTITYAYPTTATPSKDGFSSSETVSLADIFAGKDARFTVKVTTDPTTVDEDHALESAEYAISYKDATGNYEWADSKWANSFTATVTGEVVTGLEVTQPTKVAGYFTDDLIDWDGGSIKVTTTVGEVETPLNMKTIAAGTSTSGWYNGATFTLTYKDKDGKTQNALDSSSKKITADAAKAGTLTAQFTVGGIKADPFTISATALELASIELGTKTGETEETKGNGAQKISFKGATGYLSTDDEDKAGTYKFVEGTELVPPMVAAGQILATYTDGKSESIGIVTGSALTTGITLTGYNKDTVGEQTLTLTYTKDDVKKSVTVPVTVVEDYVNEVSFCVFSAVATPVDGDLDSYYEKDGTGKYIPTEDNSVEGGKTYYTRTVIGESDPLHLMLGDTAVWFPSGATAVLKYKTGTTVQVDLTDATKTAKYFEFGTPVTTSVKGTAQELAVTFKGNPTGAPAIAASKMGKIYYTVAADKAGVNVYQEQASSEFAVGKMTTDDLSKVIVHTTLTSGKQVADVDLKTALSDSRFLVRLDNQLTGAVVTNDTLKALEEGAHKIYVSWIDTDEVVEIEAAAYGSSPRSYDFTITDNLVESISVIAPTTASWKQYELKGGLSDFSTRASNSIAAAWAKDKTFGIEVTYADGTKKSIKSDVFRNAEPGTVVKLSSENFSADKAGTYPITVEYAGKTAVTTIEITAETTTAKSMDLATTGSITTYGIGQSLNVTGLKVTLYPNADKSGTPVESNVQVTKDMISGFDSSAEAKTQTLTVTYKGLTATLDIAITKPDTVTGMKFTTMPRKDEYGYGEPATVEGAVATVTYAMDGSNKDTVPYTVKEVALADADFMTTGASPTSTLDLAYSVNKNTSGTVQITFSGYAGAKDVSGSPVTITNADGKTIKYTVNSPKKIAVSGYKTEYFLGNNDFSGNTVAAEEFDTKQGIATVTYTDGSTKDVEFANKGLEFTALATTAGTQTITATYKEGTAAAKTTTFDVTIKANPATALAVKEAPKSTYALNDSLDPTKGVMTVTFASGATKDIPLVGYISETAAKGKFVLSGFDSTKKGKQTVTVTYDDKTEGFTPLTATFDVMVDEVAYTKLSIDSDTEKSISGFAWTTANKQEDVIAMLDEAIMTLTANDEQATKTEVDLFDAKGKIATGFSIEEVDFSKPGKTNVVVKYGELACEIPITVASKQIDQTKTEVVTKLDGLTPEELKIVTSLPVLSYQQGEEFDATKGFLKLVYTNGIVEYVPLNDEHIIIKGFESSKVAEKVTVTVAYVDEEVVTKATFDVQITERKIAVASITPENKTVTLQKGETYDVTAEKVTIAYSNVDLVPVTTTLADTAKVKYTITKDGAAVTTINTAVAGVYTVSILSAEDAAFTTPATITVTITDVTVTGLTLSKTSATIKKDALPTEILALANSVTATITYSDGTSWTGPITDTTKIAANITVVDVTKAGVYDVAVYCVEDPTYKPVVVKITVKDSSMPSESEIGEEIKDATDPTDVETALPVGYDIATNPVVLFTESGSGDDVTYTFVQGYASLDDAFAKGSTLTGKEATDKYVILISGKQAPGAKTKIALPKNAKAVKFIGADENAELNLGKLTAINVKDADIEFDLPVTASKNVAITVGKGHKLIIGEQAKGSVFGAIKGDKATSTVEFNADVTVASIANFLTVNTAPEKRVTIKDVAKSKGGSIKTVGTLEGCYLFPADATASGISVKKCEFDIMQGAKQGKITLDNVTADGSDAIGLVVKVLDSNNELAKLESGTTILYTKDKNAKFTKSIGIANNDEELSAVPYDTELRAENDEALWVGENHYSSFQKLFDAETSGDIVIDMRADAKFSDNTKIGKDVTSISIKGAEEGLVLTAGIKTIKAPKITIEDLIIKSADKLTINATGSDLILKNVAFDVKAGGMVLAGNKKATTFTALNVFGVDKVQSFNEVKVMGQLDVDLSFSVEALTLVAVDSSEASDESTIVFGKDATVKIGTLNGEGTIGILAPSKKFKAMSINKFGTTEEGAFVVAEYTVTTTMDVSSYGPKTSGFTFKADEKTPIFKIKDKAADAKIFDASGLSEEDNLMFKNDGKGNISLVPKLG